MKLCATELKHIYICLVMASWLSVSLIRVKGFSLSPLIIFSLKFILSEIRLVTPACFLVLYDRSAFVQSFTLMWYLPLKLKFFFLEARDR